MSPRPAPRRQTASRGRRQETSRHVTHAVTPLAHPPTRVEAHLLRGTSLQDNVVEEEVVNLVAQVVGVDGVATGRGGGAVLVVHRGRRALAQHVVHVGRGVGLPQRAVPRAVSVQRAPLRVPLLPLPVPQAGGLAGLGAGGLGRAAAGRVAPPRRHLVGVGHGEVDHLAPHPVDVVAGAVLQRRQVGGRQGQEGGRGLSLLRLVPPVGQRLARARRVLLLLLVVTGAGGRLRGVAELTVFAQDASRRRALVLTPRRPPLALLLRRRQRPLLLLLLLMLLRGPVAPVHGGVGRDAVVAETDVAAVVAAAGGGLQVGPRAVGGEDGVEATTSAAAGVVGGAVGAVAALLVAGGQAGQERAVRALRVRAAERRQARVA